METEIIETEENKMKHVLKEILSISIYLLLVFCAAYLIVTYVGQRTQVSGRSKEKTLIDGDHLIEDKISYRFEDPERFDIIVFPYQYDTDTYYIKRIIGMPGETVQIDDSGNIYVDGELLEEAYGREVIQNPGRANDPILLGDDEYFVMGDNRNNSSDSRDPSVGNIHRKDIIGRAFIRIWPSSKFGILKHQ